VPLIIDLKPGEKLIINGAVIENIGANTKLRVLNDCTLMRQKEILSDNDAVTPASRVYYALQCAYIFPEHKDKYLAAFNECLMSYVEACPSAREIGVKIVTAMSDGQYYKALKAAKGLLDHEKGVLDKISAP
jgi:flagellar biosynthesis repressor protein FlbT